MATTATTLVVHPSIPVNSVAEFVAYAKKEPVAYAHGGNGTPGHLAMEYFRLLAGFKTLPVPYRGKTNSPAYVPLVARQLAELRGGSVEEMGQRTSANFDALFRRVGV